MSADDEPTTLSNSSNDVLAKIKQLSNNYDSDKNLDEVLFEGSTNTNGLVLEEEATPTTDTKAVDPMEEVPLSAPPVPAANNPLTNNSESPLLTREQLRLPLSTTPLTMAATTAATTATTTATTTTTTTTSDSNNQTTYTTTEGKNVDLADIEALLGAGIRVTVIIDGEEVEVTQCEDTLTFGGGCSDD